MRVNFSQNLSESLKVPYLQECDKFKRLQFSQI